MLEGDFVDAENALAEIAQSIRHCQKCGLFHSRKNAVPGAGPANAEIMLIGEGPGFYENEQGLPFVGASGKFLTQLLNDAGLPRETVFITNVVKCRPPENRDPQENELQACSAYLDKQIEIINPLVIITLGRFSMARYFQKARISKIHGKATWHDGRLIIPMYHPAAALHQPKLRSVIMQDFAQLKDLIEKEKERRITASKEIEQSDDATQLSFF
ncbi:MAG: uracil-DNA glycosylase [Anaerolineaceae bacterium]|nr:uracil-DNA glycosylase [Anaerolineaceae bacterium]